MHKKTTSFMQDNEDLKAVQSDKGNISVIMLREDYNNKATQHLSNESTYAKLANTKQNITRKLEIKINNFIKDIKDEYTCK